MSNSAFNLIPSDSEIPTLYAQDGAEDATVHVKLFTPYSGFTWLLTEYCPEENLAFGFAYNASMPDCAELGYVSLEELSSLRSAFGTPGVERDILFDPMPLSEAKATYCPHC